MYVFGGRFDHIRLSETLFLAQERGFDPLINYFGGYGVRSCVMTIQYTNRSHNNGSRDPSWLFEFWKYELAMLGGLCIPAPVWFSTGIFWGWTPWLACVLVALPFPLWLHERFLDSHTDIEERSPWPSAVLEGFELIGRPRESSRVIECARVVRDARRFRQALHLDQQAVLLIMWPVILIGKSWFHGSLCTVSVIASVAYGTVFLQLFFSRLRYGVEPGVLIVERLSRLAVVDRRVISLRGIKIKADFSEGVVRVTTPDEVFTINLREMISPHHFVGSILAAASESG